MEDPPLATRLRRDAAHAARTGERPELGFLGGRTWFGRTIVMIQYWRSFEALESYAKARDRAHLPAWAAFMTGGRRQWRRRHLSRDLSGRAGHLRERLCQHAADAVRRRGSARRSQRTAGLGARANRGECRQSRLSRRLMKKRIDELRRRRVQPRRLFEIGEARRARRPSPSRRRVAARACAPGRCPGFRRAGS